MSIIQVTDRKKSSLGTDRTPFHGIKVPDEVKIMIKNLKHIDRPTWRKMLQMAVSDIQGMGILSSSEDSLEKEGTSEEKLAIIYSGLHKLAQKAMRAPAGSLKQEMMKEDLATLRIPDELASDFVTAVSKATQPGGNISASGPSLPRLQSLNWRTDVAISTNVLNRVLEPTILMDLTLSDGNVHSIEVPIAKFHELRYNVAYMLKEIESLEKRNILKVQDQQ